MNDGRSKTYTLEGTLVATITLHQAFLLSRWPLQEACIFAPAWFTFNLGHYKSQASNDFGVSGCYTVCLTSIPRGWIRLPAGMHKPVGCIPPCFLSQLPLLRRERFLALDILWRICGWQSNDVIVQYCYFHCWLNVCIVYTWLLLRLAVYSAPFVLEWWVGLRSSQHQ